MAVENNQKTELFIRTGEVHAATEATKDDSSTREAKKNSAVVFYQLGDYLESMKKLHDTDEKLEELESKAKKDSPAKLGAKNSSSKKAAKSKAPQEPIFTEDDNDTPPKLDGLTFAILSGPGAQITMNGLLTAIGQMSQYMSKLTADVTQRNSDWIKNYYEYGNINGVGEMNTRGSEQTAKITKDGDNYDVYNSDGKFLGQLKAGEVNTGTILAKLMGGSTGEISLPGDSETKGGYNTDHLDQLNNHGDTSITFTYYDTSKGTSYAPGGIDQLQKQYPADASDTKDGNGMTSGTAVSEFMKIASTIQQITQSTSTTLNSDNSVPTTSMQTVTQAISTGTSDLTTLLQALAGINSSNNTLLNK